MLERRPACSAKKQERPCSREKMADWGRMGGGQRPRPCGYVFDRLPPRPSASPAPSRGGPKRGDVLPLSSAPPPRDSVSQPATERPAVPFSVLPPPCGAPCKARPRAAACQAWLIHQADTEQTRSILPGECLLFPPLLQPCSSFLLIQECEKVLMSIHQGGVRRRGL